MRRYIVAPYTINGVTASSLEECVEYLKNQHTFCVDVETTAKYKFRNHPQGGLDPYLSKVVMLQVGTDEACWAIDVREYSKTDLKPLFKLFKDSYYRKVGQNIKFDYEMIKTNYNVAMSNIMDTMVIEQVLLCGRVNPGYSLERLAKRYLGFSYAKTNQLSLFDNNLVGLLSKQIRTEFKNIGDKPFTKEQIIYGLADVEFTYKIYIHQLSKVAELSLGVCVTLECSFLPVLAELELAGFYLDSQKWMKLYQQNLEKLNDTKRKISREIKKLGVAKFRDFQASLFEVGDETNLNINLSSSKQVVELCKALGIPTKVIDKKKSQETGSDVFKDSVEEKHLRKYENEFPIVKLYLAYKKLEKACTTYGADFSNKFINTATGRVQSRFRQILDTGRMASTSPNLQNIPNAEKFPGFRQCFTASSEDRVLVVADYSGQESRILAELSGEHNMIDFFNHGDGDLHSHTARLMFKVPVSKTENKHLRQLAKILNFG